MQLELTTEEVELLRQLVSEAAAELGPEIRHTWSRDYRKELEARREKLWSLQARLRELAEQYEEAAPRSAQ